MSEVPEDVREKIEELRAAWEKYRETEGCGCCAGYDHSPTTIDQLLEELLR